MAVKLFKRRVKRERGFSLIEMAVAITVISLVLTALLSTLALGVRNTAENHLRNTSLQVARSQIESIKHQPYTEPINAYALVTPPSTEYIVSVTGTILQAGLLQEITVNVAYGSGTSTLSAYKSKDQPPIVTGISVPTAGPTPTPTATNTPTPVPATWATLANAPWNIGAGGSLTNNGTYIYALAGGGSADFGRYDVAGNSWVTLTNAPQSTGTGAALEWTGGDFIFYLRGSDATNNFYRYQISTNTWASRTNTPATVGVGGSLSWDGSDGIYAFRGSATTAFWRYSISGNSWTTLAVAPATVDGGGSLAFVDGVTDYVYAFRGNNQPAFWRYDIGGNSWSALTSAPNDVNNGGELAYAGGDYIMGLRGDNTTDFWRYSISGNSWDVRASTLANVTTGGTLEYLNNKHYAFPGSNGPDFWHYTANN